MLELRYRGGRGRNFSFDNMIPAKRGLYLLVDYLNQLIQIVPCLSILPTALSLESGYVPSCRCQTVNGQVLRRSVAYFLTLVI